MRSNKEGREKEPINKGRKGEREIEQKKMEKKEIKTVLNKAG
jgi:hypothetical protein